MDNSEKLKDDLEGESNFNEKLNELRIAFERAVSLNNTLESKASTLLGFSALLISIIIFTLSSILSAPLNQTICDIPVEYIFFFLIVGVIIVILRGIAYLRELIKLRIYTYPFYNDPNKINKTINQPSEEFMKELIRDYRLSIPHHACINEKKKDLLDKGMKWLIWGFMISFILMLIFIYIKMACGSYG
ncbi:unnamed protein product [uncultured archaeal virus]|uniref:Uncharacterized protein n=1 Tax=uncultured archaeal virus TaxID=1960247 RepID=A0ABM9HVI3_9VIRU|nr:unnamed protein product [uncultured archaeal virus]CAI3524009.1 unnamed protein product [uncultured archaeal virus]CAI4043390.1 unnamed protein product [uncultured archaeal virus]